MTTPTKTIPLSRREAERVIEHLVAAANWHEVESPKAYNEPKAKDADRLAATLRRRLEGKE